MFNIIARIKEKMRQSKVRQEIEYQRLEEEYRERVKKEISKMVHDMFQQDKEDKEGQYFLIPRLH